MLVSEGKSECEDLVYGGGKDLFAAIRFFFSFSTENFQGRYASLRAQICQGLDRLER